MRLRTDYTGRWTEDADVVDPWCQVPQDASVAQLRSVLVEVFPDQSEVVTRFEVPFTFNLLIEWIPGDLRWPIAALLLRKGLVDGVEYSARDVAEWLKRGVKSVENVTRPAGHQSYVTFLRNALYFCGGFAQPNELRAMGMWSVEWTSLARAEVRTVDRLCALNARQLLTIDGISVNIVEHIVELLAERGRSLQK